MAIDQSEQFGEFLAKLRGESTHGPGRGVGRFARLVRNGVGLARGVMSASRRGTEAEPGELDLRHLEALVMRLGELKGLPMKFGQIVSYLELDLPEEVRQLLGALQTQSPALGFERAETVIREDLGKAAETLLARLEREPVAIASIGQVFRGRLPDGTAVAVKVRHPDIEQAIRSDFRAATVGTGLAGALAPGIELTGREFVSEMRARLLEECDYRLEAERQKLFGSLYHGHPVVVVPEVFEAWCGPRVLTTRWETGAPFEEFRQRASQAERDRAGQVLFDFYIGTLYRHGLFHADPHPGNYQFRDDGKLVVFDYGCVRLFEPDVAQAFVALPDAVRSDDRARVTAALRGMGAEPSANDAAYAHLRTLLRGFFRPMLTPGPSRIDGRIAVDMKQMTRDKLAIARLRLPGRFMFLFRIRFGLYAVLSRLGSVCDWAGLEHGFAEQAGLAASTRPAG